MVGALQSSGWCALPTTLLLLFSREHMTRSRKTSKSTTNHCYERSDSDASHRRADASARGTQLSMTRQRSREPLAPRSSSAQEKKKTGPERLSISLNFSVFSRNVVDKSVGVLRPMWMTVENVCIAPAPWWLLCWIVQHAALSFITTRKEEHRREQYRESCRRSVLKKQSRRPPRGLRGTNHRTGLSVQGDPRTLAINSTKFSFTHESTSQDFGFLPSPTCCQRGSLPSDTSELQLGAQFKKQL